MPDLTGFNLQLFGKGEGYQIKFLVKKKPIFDTKETLKS
jgi:hypothetical protein